MARRRFWKEWEHRVRCGDEDGGSGDGDREEEERDGCWLAAWLLAWCYLQIVEAQLTFLEIRNAGLGDNSETLLSSCAVLVESMEIPVITSVADEQPDICCRLLHCGNAARAANSIRQLSSKVNVNVNY